MNILVPRRIPENIPGLSYWWLNMARTAIFDTENTVFGYFEVVNTLKQYLIVFNLVMDIET